MSSSLRALKSQVGTKKFMTRGEELYLNLKEIGYKPSKHLQHEHLEYLFRDGESSKVVRKLMTLKPENTVSLEEIERFETLKSQEAALYGDDLEEAVNRHRTVLQLHDRHNEKLQATVQEIKEKLAEEKNSFRHVTVLEHCILKVADKEGERWDRIKRMLLVVHSHYRENEHAAEAILRMLRDNMRRLGETTLSLRRAQKDFFENVRKDRNAHYLCQMDGVRMLEKEEKLFQRTLDVLRNHGPALILKEAGQQVEGDTLSAENIQKICLNYKNNFNRVSHCIIYERTNKVFFEILVAELERCLEKFEECSKRAQQISYANGGLNDSRSRCAGVCGDYFNQQGSDGDLSDLNDPILQRFKELVVSSMAKQFSTLTDIKVHARRKLVKFFNTIVNVLKTQKVRVTLTRNLCRGESKLYGKLVTSFEDTICLNSNSKKRLSQSIKQDPNLKLTLEGQILSFVCTKSELANPKEILSSTNKALLAAKKINDDVESLKWKKIEEQTAATQKQFKHDLKVAEVVRNVFDESWHRATERYDALKVDRHEVKSLAERWNKLQLDSINILEENKKARKESLDKLKKVLSEKRDQNQM